MLSRRSDFDPQEQEFVDRVQLPKCPNLSLLNAAREGVLASDEATLVGAHLASCGVCRTLFEDLEAIDFGAPTAADSRNTRERIANHAPRAFRVDHPKSGWFGQRWWIPAFAVAGCALLVFLVLRGTKTSAPAPAQISQAKRLPLVALEKLPIHIDASALLATRGASDGTEAPGPDLAKALLHYENDDYTGAAQRLQVLAQKYPKDGNVRLYLGISDLYLQQDNDAAVQLTSAAAILQDARWADAEWYLGIAVLRLNHPELAAPVFRRLCDGKNTYSNRACGVESQIQ